MKSCLNVNLIDFQDGLIGWFLMMMIMLSSSQQQRMLSWFITCHSSFSLHPWAIIMVWWFILPKLLLRCIDGFSHS